MTDATEGPQVHVETLRHGLFDLAFRVLFSTIFLGLGAEHVFHDDLLQVLVPSWVPWPRAASFALGLVLLAGGASILFGWHVRRGAVVLGAVVLFVTFAVHVPGLFSYPPNVAPDSRWLWDMFQRSNLVKNVCLLGVCIHLFEHAPGRFSFDRARQRGPTT